MCYIKACSGRACPKSTADQKFRTALEEADYPLRKLIEKPDEVPWGRNIVLARDDDRGADIVDALSLDEVSVAGMYDERDRLGRPDSAELMNVLLLEEMGTPVPGEEYTLADWFVGGDESFCSGEVSVLERQGDPAVIDEGHDPLNVFEQEDRMNVLLLVLEKAQLVGIVADPDSEEFIVFAHSVIAQLPAFREQAKMGFAS